MGIFIKKHVMSIPGNFDSSVIFPVKIKNLATKYEIDIIEEADALSILIYYRESGVNIKPVSMLISTCRYIRAFIKGIGILKRKKGRPDIVHVHVLLRTALFAFYFRMWHKIPYVISEHWSGYLKGNFNSRPVLYKFLLKWIVRKAAAVTAVSEGLRKAMLSNGIRHKTFYIVPNIIDPPHPGIIPSEKSSAFIQILTVADLVDEIKNISGILKALAAVKQRIRPFQYHIIGDGQDKEYLINLARELGLGSNVIFHGRKDNDFVYGFIRNIDFMVVNSNVETFSVVTAETLIHGKPVIGTICGGPETFINNDNGMLVMPGDQPQLQNALVRMAGTYQTYDPDIIFKTVSERFNTSHIGKEFEKIYVEVLDNV